MTEIEKKTGMTNAEAEYWDDYYTQNPPDIDLSRNRARRHLSEADRTVVLDELSADYFFTKSLRDHTTPAAIISNMVRREIAAASV